ncbi:hypothetical protein OBBRIDRAFT_733561 [Obba rivulosa]|uniref:Uncharacterized protein n=1 Tax=Obba rivulosa TaxID=1052685 RepID=A0A8E2AV49_9APHY|nr:hypothetical protein OBBRIDRAFT_733561 [Obba rivulosa]
MSELVISPGIDYGLDELDIISAISPTLVSPSLSAGSTPEATQKAASAAGTRTLRPRRAVIIVTPEKGKRKRAVSLSVVDNTVVSKPRKRSKVEDKKALTIVVNTAKIKLETARKRWLYVHRDLFTPLLPDSSVVFDNIARELGSSNGKLTCLPLHELDEQPKLVTGGVMKDYQLHGLSFLSWMYNNGMNCVLGDEMGLGKTLQTLSLLAYIQENFKGSHDPHLIICPLSVLPSWLSEAARWVPSFRTLRFHGQQSERQRLKDGIRAGEIEFDICITTYEAYVAEDSWFKTRRWMYCVLDEGHKIKNADTNVATKLQGLGSLYRLVLTGTPVQNNLVELWGILHFLYPTIFTSASSFLFRSSFDLTRGTYDLRFIQAAEALLAKVMLRRTKAAVEMSVPPREELTVFVPMTEAQRFWTYRLLTRMDALDLESIFEKDIGQVGEDEGRREVKRMLEAQVKRGSAGEQSQWKKLMNVLIQLRKVCDHPYLLKDVAPEPFSLGEHIIASSSKLILLDKLLADLLPKGERVLIFSQWTNMLDLLEDFIALRRIRYARLDGSTTRPRRALDIKLFQQEKSPYDVFLISTKAGGLGINLTKATTVIMFDSDWNPQNDLQAIARAHRIGQTKTVKVYRLICRGSVEDQMLDRIRRKLFLSVKVMGSSSTPSNDETSSQLKMSELMDILRKGSSALSTTDDGMNLARFLNAPISVILEDSRARDQSRSAVIKQREGETLRYEDQKLVEDAEAEERRLLMGVAQVQSRLFEGRVIKRAAPNREIAEEWRQLQKRSRTDRIIKVDGMEMIADYMGPEVVIAAKPAIKRQRRKFESEDWCIHCRDGGELVLCCSCPRVFHAKCHGLTKVDLKRPQISCSQHSCVGCNRSTSDAGGMLFRCQTCPQAFCEDCLPPGDLDAVGDVLPELLLLGYGPCTSAYYIRCHDCHAQWDRNPKLWQAWQKEMKETQTKLEAMYTLM